MLPKKRRIERKEFSPILTTGKRYNSPHLLLYVAKIGDNNKNKETKFSFSVSKKVCKNAVDRNKYRRQGYSVISKNIKQIKPGYLCSFSFKKGRGSIDFSTLEKEIVQLLSDALVLI